MIRYRYPGLELALAAAAACDHPRLARLRTCAPWLAIEDGPYVVLELQLDDWQPAEWGTWMEGLDGCQYQTATNAELTPLRRQNLPIDAEWVELGAGQRGPVLPAYAEGMDLDLTGKVEARGSGAYCQAVEVAQCTGPQITWAQMLPVAQHAIMSGHRCPPELAYRLRLINTASAVRLLGAAYGLPPGKAESADAG